MVFAAGFQSPAKDDRETHMKMLNGILSFIIGVVEIATKGTSSFARWDYGVTGKTQKGRPKEMTLAKNAKRRKGRGGKRLKVKG